MTVSMSVKRVIPVSRTDPPIPWTDPLASDPKPASQDDMYDIPGSSRASRLARGPAQMVWAVSMSWPIDR